MTYKIIERKMIVPNIHELTVEAPQVASSVQPGQFVIIRPNDKGERMPLSIADLTEMPLGKKRWTISRNK